MLILLRISRAILCQSVRGATSLAFNAYMQ
jgi:hypothetical protein